MSKQRVIEVVANWVGLEDPTLMGHLTATPARALYGGPHDGHRMEMLITPGGSLGGARPKASVRDERDRLWIATFPSRNDEDDIGAWELVVHDLAERARVVVPEAQLRRFGKSKGGGHGHHTFLSRRFDRTDDGRRLHFASAMTLLDRIDGQSADDGVSYVELADLLIRLGSNTSADLEQLFRRIVFFICVSNTDDHLRNHGFMLMSTTR
jgi:serine/threonine-protein kinase HipA